MLVGRRPGPRQVPGDLGPGTVGVHRADGVGGPPMEEPGPGGAQTIVHGVAGEGVGERQLCTVVDPVPFTEQPVGHERPAPVECAQRIGADHLRQHVQIH